MRKKLNMKNFKNETVLMQHQFSNRISYKLKNRAYTKKNTTES